MLIICLYFKLYFITVFVCFSLFLTLPKSPSLLLILLYILFLSLILILYFFLFLIGKDSDSDISDYILNSSLNSSNESTVNVQRKQKNRACK